MSSLNIVKQVRNGNLKVLKDNKWLSYLYFTKENRLNLERVESIKDIQENFVLDYVEKTLMLCDSLDIPDKHRRIVEEVLKWSEVSKCGLPHQRERWENLEFNLFVHNIGSSQIYAYEYGIVDSNIEDIIEKHIINVLIATHGLIGQAIRGEVNFRENMPLTELVINGYIDSHSLKTILNALNYCIIGAVSLELWDTLKNKVSLIVENIVNNRYNNEYPVKERIKKLRNTAIIKGEDFDGQYENIINDEIHKIFEFIFSKSYLWYVEGALADFSFEEFTKIFLILFKKCNPLTVKHITFENLMHSFYYDYKSKKAVNLYKKRIVEKYLSNMSFEDILNGEIPTNEHVNLKVIQKEGVNNTISVDFEFSPAGSKLIEFCQEAEKSMVYEKGILLLYDLFGFRRDQFDRFHNEKTYMETMNKSINHKAMIVDYIVGEKVVDIGPGGGALMDMIVERYPEKKVLGIDIATNEVEALNQRRIRENRPWGIIQGDATELDKCADKIKEFFGSDTVDTFTYSSIIHHIFSFSEIDGKVFNYDSIKKTLKTAFDLLSPGGRIIIRDGIMTEPKDQYRIIKFKDPKGMKFLEKYCEDFKGREIKYEKLGEDTVKMLINDSMEFLYTYTWGEESYNHEVKEQFGYFTPSEYVKFISDVLGESAKVLECKHYLQDGYEKHLLTKASYMDESFSPVRLPDSTCFIVIEKGRLDE